ncbi:hypothetical protein BRADI_1g66918v3 [Brachypodium distachyon]|uniref:Uncharacterized protein n=1 Tax=Brachypodium distachyon TaxID=15368 RepID=A0A2K2DTT7_BRADI|nr:hypothetical protein BRADI_1g66918v3 [Brachypodium distachyon]
MYGIRSAAAPRVVSGRRRPARHGPGVRSTLALTLYATGPCHARTPRPARFIRYKKSPSGKRSGVRSRFSKPKPKRNTSAIRYFFRLLNMFCTCIWTMCKQPYTS